VVPHGNDQFAWGQRVHELGAGAAYIPRKELTAARLAAAIDQALQPDVHAAAAALGEKIRQENGAERAATIIMETVRSSVPA